MKRYLILIPLIIGSCNTKKETIDNVENKTDAELIAPADNPTSAYKQKVADSVKNNLPATKEVLRQGVMREESGSEIVREADASLLAFTIGEEITKDNQKFILKLKNVNQPKISVSLVTQNKDMNLRISNIKNPDGTLDGPFNKSITYDTPKKGDYWIIVGPNKMAEGKRTGAFSISVK